MKIRDSRRINKELGSNALPHGFVSGPIMTFKTSFILDDIGFEGCPYVNDTKNARRYSSANYINYWWIADSVREPLGKALGIPESRMVEHDFY